MSLPRERVQAAASRFSVPGTLEAVAPHDGGHINDGHLLTYRDGDLQRRYLLQRLNPAVFREPRLVMENFERVTEHLREVCRAEGVRDLERRVLSWRPTREGERCWVDADGAGWRILPYIERAYSLSAVTYAREAAAVGRAFGAFGRRLSDLPPGTLHQVLPGFHDTMVRFELFLSALERAPEERVLMSQAEIDQAGNMAPLAQELAGLVERGHVPIRVIHGDAGVRNVLLDQITGEGLCVVDLDTVMPGTMLWDFGDMMRTMSCPCLEDDRELSRVAVDPDLFTAMARAYLQEMSDLLTPTERRCLVKAGQVITYEQALRFLTDFLSGDHYYPVSRPAHNLDRARMQLALLRSFVQNEAYLELVLEDLLT